MCHIKEYFIFFFAKIEQLAERITLKLHYNATNYHYRNLHLKETKIQKQSKSKLDENNFTNTIEFPASEVSNDALTKSDILLLEIAS